MNALKALDDARRKAPFLSKWKHFPPKQTAWAEWEVGQVAQSEWREFLKQLQVESLGYEGVSIPKIMTWYDSARAPFSDKKKKEFPDAFAIEIVSIYAEKNETCVAVVSADHDIRKACEPHPLLLYFPSLSQLTELLLIDEQKIEKFRDILNNDIGLLEKTINEQIKYFQTHIDDDRFQEEESSIGSAQIIDIRVIGLGNNECTVAFEAEYESAHKLNWEDQADPNERDTDIYSDWITQSNTITGTAKLETEAKTGTVCSVNAIEVDQSEIEIQKTPRPY